MKLIQKKVRTGGGYVIPNDKLNKCLHCKGSVFHEAQKSKEGKIVYRFSRCLNCGKTEERSVS